MIRYFTTLLMVLCMTNLHAQSLTQSIKNHIMSIRVISAESLTRDIASNRIKLNNIFNKMKEDGGYPFILIQGEISDLKELNVGCSIAIKGDDLFQELHLFSAIDEDVYDYYKGQEVYAFISPYSLGKYDSYFDIAILSTTKEGLAEKIIAIVNAIQDYPNKYGLLQHLLDVKSSSYNHIGIDNSINAFVKYFRLKN